MYESKWGYGPLVIHPLRGCTDCKATPVTYYRLSTHTDNRIEYDPQSWETISGSGIVSSPTTYTVSYVPEGAWAVWTPSSYLSEVSGQHTSTYTVQPNPSNPNGTLTGTVTVKFESKNSSCSSHSSILTKQVSIKKPIILENISSISTSQYDPGPGTSTPINVPEGTWVHFYCQPFVSNDLNDLTPSNSPDSHGATGYTWTCNPSSYTLNPEPNNSRSVLITFNQPYYYTLTATEYNDSGSKQYQQSIYVTPGWYFSLSPNPASSNVTVTMLKGNKPEAGQTVTGNDLTESIAQTVTNTTPEAQTNVPVTYTVKIVNSFGSLFYSSKKTGDSFTIPVDNLRKGNYLIQISDGKTVSSQTLIISR
jgi:hypothetical protein